MPATTAYAPGTAYDEAFDADGVPRPHCASLVEELARLGRDDLAARRALVDAAYMRQGTTFTVYGEEAGGERPFPLDLVPRVVAAAEWAELERGLRQRVEALDAFLADVYGPQRILRDRVVPRDLVLRSPGFRAEAAGIAPPGGTYIHVCGTDLIRDRAGIWRVLEDNTRVPSGISYVLENRLVLKRVLPSLFGAHAVRPVDHYPAAFLQALRSLAPPGRDDPVVVLLTPGPYSSAYFEHAFLAKQLGVPLVEGRDLAAHDNRLWMRTTRGLARVDVVYRRIDDDFLDPLAFRADSVLGVPGLANAARAGNVALANAIGTGAADDKAVYPFVPAMIRYYLAEEPLLAQVETFRGAEPSHLSHMLAHADELVIKATDGAGGAGMLIGPQASAGERTSYLERVRARPAGYVAQPLIDLSTCPCLVDGRLEPRHVDLRPFIVRGHDETTIIPGGLTRVALRRGSVVVNSSQGGGSKDTWVLADEIPPPPPARDDAAIEPLATRAAAGGPPGGPPADPLGGQ